MLSSKVINYFINDYAHENFNANYFSDVHENRCV